MQLHIDRKQGDKGRSFEVALRLQLDAEEERLVTKYGLEKVTVCDDDTSLMERGPDAAAIESAGGVLNLALLRRGVTLLGSLHELLTAERETASGCRALKSRLESSERYTGSVVVEI